MIATPLDQFTIIELIGITAPIVHFSAILNTVGLYLIVAALLTIIIPILGTTDVIDSADGGHNYPEQTQYLIPTRWSVFSDAVYATILTMTSSAIGSRHTSYTPLIYGLFLIIAINNLEGNIPYGYASFSSAIGSLGLSITIFISVTILAFNQQGTKFFGSFLPSGTPSLLVLILILIELVSYTARALSLGVRLFANLVAGHTLLAILSGMLSRIWSIKYFGALFTIAPFTIFVALIGLELAVSLIQAYVFTMLTCTYIHDALEGNH